MRAVERVNDSDLEDKHANEVLRAVRAATSVTFSEIQASTGLPQARVFDMLGRLMASGLVARSETGFVSASAAGADR